MSNRNNFVADYQMSQTGPLFFKNSLYHAKYLDFAPLSPQADSDD